MKRTLMIAVLLVSIANLNAQKTINLLEHSKSRGMDVMSAFQNRQSYRSYEAKELGLQDLSDLLWAANGINRPESGKRTAPSAMNAQEVDIYVCRADGAYLYDAKANSIKQVSTEDLRPLSDGNRPTGAPIILLIVTDVSRYGGYQPGITEANKRTVEMGTLDAGIVAQNICIFCAGAGLGTVPRASMDEAGIRKALNFKQSQMVWLNLPVGFPKK